MVRLTKIYTRGGDKGQTSLGNGARVDKHDVRVDAYGTVDEANAMLGIARLHCADDAETDQMLARLQQDLFDLGADLCTPQTEAEDKALRICQAQVQRLEDEIDAMNESLAPLNSFILPGGTPTGAYLHAARTIARRAERLMTQLAAIELVNPLAIAYINRLSDHLFVLSRHVNDNGRQDVLWVPGLNR